MSKLVQSILAISLAVGMAAVGVATARCEQLHSGATGQTMTRDEFYQWWQSQNLVNQSKTNLDHAEQPVAFAPQIETLNAKIASIAYVLGAGDVINIDVNNKPQFSRSAITLGSEDLISLPMIGEVKVQGKTVTQLSQELTEAYREYLVEPQVSIVVQKPRMQVSYVLGAVDTPGPYKQLGQNSAESTSTVPDFRLSTAIANAGGMLSEADIQHVQVYNTQFGYHQEVNLYDLILHGQVENDVTMKPNDVVYVPRLTNPEQTTSDTFQLLARSVVGKHEYPVRVVGLVRNPNVYALKPDEMNLQSVIAKSGGLLPNASAKRVFIARADATGHLNKVVVDSTSQDFALQPQDIVMVSNVNGLTRLHQVFDLAATILKPLMSSSFIFQNIDAIWGLSSDDTP